MVNVGCRMARVAYLGVLQVLGLSRCAYRSPLTPAFHALVACWANPVLLLRFPSKLECD